MVPLELIGAMCSPTVGGGVYKFWKMSKISCVFLIASLSNFNPILLMDTNDVTLKNGVSWVVKLTIFHYLTLYDLQILRSVEDMNEACKGN